MGPEDFQLGDLVCVEWRDSYCQSGQHQAKDIDDDARWASVGFVIRLTDMFLTVTPGVCLVGEMKGDIDSPLSIPWTQILEAQFLWADLH